MELEITEYMVNWPRIVTGEHIQFMGLERLQAEAVVQREVLDRAKRYTASREVSSSDPEDPPPSEAPLLRGGRELWDLSSGPAHYVPRAATHQKQ